MSDEDKIQHKINLSTSLKNHYTNETLEDKQRRSKISKNIATNRTNEEKQRISKILSECQLERYSKETPKEKEERKLIHRLAWEKKPQLEKDEHRQNSIDRENTRKNNLTYENFVKEYQRQFMIANDNEDRLVGRKLQKTELQFKELLEKNFIIFNMFEYNLEMYPNFYNMFPYNPYTKLHYTLPFHEWDFILFLEGTNIFVDIDGSRHNLAEMNFEAFDTSSNSKINVAERQYFYDSLRPYQTDKLDAYIIKCYNNDIYKDDAKIVNLKTNEEMTIKEFIKYCDQVIKDNYKKN